MEDGARWPSAGIIPELGRTPMKIRSSVVLWRCQKIRLHLARVSARWQLLALSSPHHPFLEGPEHSLAPPARCRGP